MAYVLIAIGLVLMFAGIAGTWLLPDLLMRLHASTKCGVTGSLTLLMGFIVHTRSPGFTLKLLLIMVFIFITAPIVAHALALSHFIDRGARQGGKQQ